MHFWEVLEGPLTLDEGKGHGELDQAGEFGPHPQTQMHPEQIALEHK